MGQEWKRIQWQERSNHNMGGPIATFRWDDATDEVRNDLIH
ncbi:MAG: hypothetical protein ACXW0J_01990 [Nitrososphaeraceae archaeon]